MGCSCVSLNKKNVEAAVCQSLDHEPSKHKWIILVIIALPVSGVVLAFPPSFLLTFIAYPTRKNNDSDTRPYMTGGFLPIICLDGANVQYCEVSKSNNGWVIEIFNAAADVTLWLDPATPTSLLKWGSVLCQALACAEPSDDGDTFPAVQEEGERDLDDEDAVAS